MYHATHLSSRPVLLALLVSSLFAALLASASASAAPDRPEPMQTIALATANPVNINSANAEQLAEALFGIGAAKAAEIVAYRQQHGSFSSVEELLNIKGIGRKTLERNRARVVAE
jgi:competence protein ComEA